MITSSTPRKRSRASESHSLKSIRATPPTHKALGAYVEVERLGTRNASSEQHSHHASFEFFWAKSSCWSLSLHTPHGAASLGLSALFPAARPRPTPGLVDAPQLRAAAHWLSPASPTPVQTIWAVRAHTIHGPCLFGCLFVRELPRTRATGPTNQWTHQPHRHDTRHRFPPQHAP